MAGGTAFLVDAANGVLANDTDADDATLVVAAVEGSAAGVGTEITLASGALLTVNANGSFSYTPAAGFSGPDSFSYTVGDGTDTGEPVSVSLTVGEAPPFSLYIDAGSSAPYTSTDGIDYVADSFFTGGRTYSKNVTVNGTDEVELFQTERFGTFDYVVPVDDGTYAVTLEFAEIYFNEAGKRVFDVEIENQLKVDDLDIFAAAGGKNIAYSTGPITIEVTDGALNIEFLKGIQNPKINAISIVRLAVDGEPPAAVADSYVATEDTTRTVSAAFGVLNNDTDPDGDALTASLVSGPSNGTLVLNADGSFEYTPDAEFSGTDSFTYAASDGTGNSTEATATITVDAVNDAPEGAADAYATPSGAPLAVDASAGLLVNDTDIEGDALVVAAVEGSASNVGATITLESGATLTVNADGSFAYVPAAGFSGPDSFTYAPGDGTDAGSPVTVTIDVAGGGAPEVTTNAGLGLDEGATAAIGAGLLATTDSDTPAADLVYTLTSVPANGTLSLDGTVLGLGDSFTQADVDAGLISYAHDGSETTTDGFGFDVTDGDFPVVGQTFEITVDPVNDAPVGTADGGYQVALDTAFSVGAASGLLANDTDAEGGPLAVASVEGSAASVGTAITLNSGATLTVNADGSFAYTPAAGFSGPDSFTYAPGDGDAVGAPVTVSLTVAPGEPSFELNLNAGGGNYTAVDGTAFVADTPYAVSGRTYSKSGAIADTQDDTLYQSERYGTFGYDIAVEDGTYSVVFEFAEIYFNEAGKRVFDVEIEDDVVLDDFDIFAAAGGKNVAYSTNPIVVDITDGTLDIDFLQGVQNPKVSAIRVTSFVAVGEPPVATPDSYSVGEDTTLTVAAAGVLANDSDPDSATIVASLVSGTSNGILTLNSDGSFEYVPDADFAGTDSFTYSVSDGNGNTDQATATITVNPVNDAPTGADDSYVSPSNTTLSVNAAGGLLANDSDVDGSFLDVATVNGSLGSVGTAITLGSGATLVVNADGSFEYTPTGGFSGVDTFTYAPGDGSLIGEPVTVTIDVSGGAAPEVATNAGLTLDEGGTATIGGGALETTDADTPAADLVYTLTSAPSHGTLSLDGGALGVGDAITQADIDAGLLGYAHDGSEAPEDSFGFSVTDGVYTLPGQSFAITLDPVNDVPVANDDALSTAFGKTVNIDVLGNDVDADGDPLQIVSVGAATNGTVEINDNGTPGDTADDYLIYTGDTAGTDTFDYTISDGNGGTATATVEVEVEPLQPIAFSKVVLTGVPNKNWTSLEFGPDGRLYASHRFGELYAFDIEQEVDGNGTVTGYHATSSERIDLIKSIPNHDDDGALNLTVTNRQITGILLDGTPENPVLYVSSSDPREGGGGGGGEGDLGLDTNSGVISRLTWNGTAWEKVDLVRGLPRSEENHSTNGLDMMVDPETGARTLLVAQGGNTNAGAPSKNFAYSSEYALSGAILEIDLDRVESGTGDFAVKTGGNGQSYVYDIPTVQGPVFGGMDGLNQARIVAGGPVQVYSSGYRNPYDVVVTEDGDVFTIDNGANKGWGGVPEGEGTANVTDQIPTDDPDGFNSVNNLDHLEYIPGRGYYAGHPNPIRANPDGAGLTFTDANGNEIWVQSPSGAWPPVDPGILFPEDGDFRLPGVEDDALVTWTVSTNGLDEYTASNFQGALQGNLITAAFDKSIYRIVVDPSNGSATKEVLAEGLGGVPLDVVAQGDADPFAGTIWVAYVNGQAEIEVLVPTGLSGNPNDFDGDGYSNADELANGTNPNSPSSVPPDNDGDLVSDLGDSDDDNDLLLDPVDHFAIDALNGTDIAITDSEGYFNPLRNDNPGTGFAGLGFKGWMTNGTTDYLNQYDDDNLIAGGTSGIFTISETTPGDARGGLNTQDNGFQYGVTLATTGPVIVKASMLNVFQPLSLADLEEGQFAGIQIGTGDQDNYVKLAVAVNPSGALDLVALYEENGVVVEETFALDTTVAIGSQVDLFLEIDPVSGDVTPGWTVDGGPGRIGQTIDVGGDVLDAIRDAYQNGGQDSAMAVGVIASHGDTGTPFAAQYDYIDIFASTLADQFDLIA